MPKVGLSEIVVDPPRLRSGGDVSRYLWVPSQ